ncbi:hypothetical protein Lnau_0295 [Legionella nautarum]|uniref:Uncharacterized protein n=1 Tax=Legionella nautarum TaxID=45070 RepID=A0A0W0X3M7_9GAMM|nr:hypothetical protein [Legionella nautarum]KTD39096.1 hypothetical protein Lnau_0295 [Legionella nautarum]
MRNFLLSPPTSPDDLEKYVNEELAQGKKELSFFNLRLDFYTAEQITAFLKKITQAGVTSLHFKNNELGSTIKPECWVAFFDGLIDSSIKKLLIDDNQIHQLDLGSWKAMDNFIEKCKSRLELVSLQNNNLVLLCDEKHEVLNRLVHHLACPCLISLNNWHTNLSRWGELTFVENTSQALLLARHHILTTRKTQADFAHVEDEKLASGPSSFSH